MQRVMASIAFQSARRVWSNPHIGASHAAAAAAAAAAGGGGGGGALSSEADSALKGSDSLATLMARFQLEGVQRWPYVLQATYRELPGATVLAFSESGELRNWAKGIREEGGTIGGRARRGGGSEEESSGDKRPPGRVGRGRTGCGRTDPECECECESLGYPWVFEP